MATGSHHQHKKNIHNHSIKEGQQQQQQQQKQQSVILNGTSIAFHSNWITPNQ